MTMTSLIVSVTFVILPLAAAQLGSRLISTFLADRQIQIALGLFLGTIVYVLVVLGSLDEAGGDTGVPRLAVSVGGMLTILCLFALLFYVDKFARSIIADNVVERVSSQLRLSIREMLPEDSDESRPGEDAIVLPPAGTIDLGRSGYIQIIDHDELDAEARPNEAVIELNVRAGHFVLRHGDHIVVHSRRSLEQIDARAIRAAFVIGPERSSVQDLEYNVRQLVEVGVRALSTGINDPFTAMAVIDHLGVAMEEIFARAIPPTNLMDEAGELRLVTNRSDFAGLVEAAFNPIRQAAGDVPAVTIRIADVLGRLAPSLRSETQKNALLRQLIALGEVVKHANFASGDLQIVMGRIDDAQASIRAGSRLSKEER